MASKKEYNWEYYKPKLQEYCLQNLSYSNRIPSHSRHYMRLFYSPAGSQVIGHSTGNFSIFDPKDPRYGTNFTMWKDFMTGESGNIYKLIMIKEGAASMKEAYARCEEVFGKAPEMEKQTKQQKQYRRYERQRFKENRFKRTQEQYKDEARRCQAQRQWIEKKMIENLQATGCFFPNMKTLPYQIGFDRQSKKETYHTMTCANYFHAMLLNQPDPRYMTAADIKRAGWKVREGAIPVSFEYLETKDEPYHLVTWKLYNGKDIIGIPNATEKPPLSKESVYENIGTMLQGNGIKTEDTEQLFKDPEALIEQLRKLASDNTWHDAKVEGQRALERELTTTRLLQQVGVTTNYKVKDVNAIIDHLERDLYKKDSKNLFFSGYSMDSAVKVVTGKYQEEALKEVMAFNQNMKKMAAMPFTTLQVETLHSINLDGREIPKGARLEGEKAYKFLADVIREDKRLFEDWHHPQYGKTASFIVKTDVKPYTVDMRLGYLDGGNQTTVVSTIKEAALRQTKNLAYTDAIRQTAVEERIQMNRFNSPEYDEAMRQNPQICMAKEEQKLIEEFQQKDMELTQSFASFKDQEALYLSAHPEMKYVKERADTYLYFVPKESSIERDSIPEPVILKGAEEVWQAYEPDIVTAVRTPEFYGKKDMSGYVIETRQALVPDGKGTFMAPHKQLAESIPAQAFLTEREETKLREFEEKFKVKIVSGKDSQLYTGTDGRLALAYAMQDDREMYEHQQSGYKPVELSTPQQITVQYGQDMLINKTYFNGTLELGNTHSVADTLKQLCKNHEQVLREVTDGIRISEKYSDVPEITALLHDYTPQKAEEIQKNISREFLPEGMNSYHPKVGQTAENDMKWYEAKAIVNYCKTDEEKADYIVAELAKKYKVETIKRRIDEQLPVYKNFVEKSLKRPEIQTVMQKREERKLTFLADRTQKHSTKGIGR